MRRRAGTLLVLAMSIGAACSSSESGTRSDASPSVDASSPNDGSPAAEGGTSDGRVTQDAAVDGPTDGGADADAKMTPAPFTLTSTAYAAGGSIPAVHTCNGANLSPPLSWSDAPAGTQSYAVVMRDISLASADNYHWVIYDIPAATTSLPQGVQSGVASPPVPAGAKQTYWSFGASYSYLGPCPPTGIHEYQLTVYAFSTPTLAVPAGTTDPAVVDAVIQANKTDSATLTGKYKQ